MNSSYSTAASRKRHANDRSTTAPPTTSRAFRPSNAYSGWLRSERVFGFQQKPLPKSHVRHGLRVNFGFTHELKMGACKQAAAKHFKGIIYSTECLNKGYFDLGFKTKEEADEAAKVTLVVEGRPVFTTRTRLPGDETLFISFDLLPTDVAREETCENLIMGLASYGEVRQFEMEVDKYLPQCARQKAFAVIIPNEDVKSDIQVIPRQAYFHGLDGRTFKITPEGAPPVCSKCKDLGHTPRQCDNLGHPSEEMDGQPWDYNNPSHPMHPIEWGFHQENIIAPVESVPIPPNTTEVVLASPPPQPKPTQQIPVVVKQIEKNTFKLVKHQKNPAAASRIVTQENGTSRTEQEIIHKNSWAELSDQDEAMDEDGVPPSPCQAKYSTDDNDDRILLIGDEYQQRNWNNGEAPARGQGL